MRLAVHFLALGVLAQAHAGEEQAASDLAREVLAEAVQVQGNLDRGAIRDVRLVFEGTWKEEGRHAIRREYLYRSADRSFAISTRSRAVKSEVAERGVFGNGGRGYWELSGKGERLTLSPVNRDDRKVIQTIEDERAKFEQMLEVVFLARLGNGDTKITLGSPEPVRLLDDEPHEARSILGGDAERQERTYHVLDVERPRQPRLRLYLSTHDYTVRKAVSFRPDAPERPEWVYYFGPYVPRPGGGLLLPRFLSVHADVPRDRESRDETSRAWGQLTVEFNQGLPDGVFAP